MGLVDLKRQRLSWRPSRSRCSLPWLSNYSDRRGADNLPTPPTTQQAEQKYSMKKPTVDYSKPVKTRRGDPVEIIATCGRPPMPVIGYIGEDNVPIRWTKGGWYYVNQTPCDFDLFNV